MSNKEKKHSDETGLKFFVIGFLIMLLGVLLDFIDLDAVGNVIAWVGFFIGAIGIIINFQILLNKKNKRK